MKTPVQLTFNKDTLITHELRDCSGSNQVLRAPTPLTKDVSRVYPPILYLSLPPCLFSQSPPSFLLLFLFFCFLWPCSSLSVALVALSPVLPRPASLPVLHLSTPFSNLCGFLPYPISAILCPVHFSLLFLSCSALALCCPFWTVPYCCVTALTRFLPPDCF